MIISIQLCLRNIIVYCYLLARCRDVDDKTNISKCDVFSFISNTLQYIVSIAPRKPQRLVYLLKLTFRKYPAIHTNYIISHCTTLQNNHNI